MRQRAYAVCKERFSFERPLLSFGTFCKHFKSPQRIQAEKNSKSHNIYRNGRYFSCFVKILLILDPAPQLLPCRFAVCSCAKWEERVSCPWMKRLNTGTIPTCTTCRMVSSQVGVPRAGGHGWRRQGSPAAEVAVLTGSTGHGAAVPNG